MNIYPERYIIQVVVDHEIEDLGAKERELLLVVLLQDFSLEGQKPPLPVE